MHFINEVGQERSGFSYCLLNVFLGEGKGEGFRVIETLQFEMTHDRPWH
jgi:hypothetical protein